MKMALTFKVADVKVEKYQRKHAPIEDLVKKKYCVQEDFINGDKPNGHLIRIEDESTSETCVNPELGNGLLGTAFEAYNQHHELILKPDDIWIAIGTVFAGFVDRNHESMRNTFVNHEGKIELVAYSVGNIYSTNYPDLISQIVSQIEKNTKKDVREWMECDFSTTTKTTLVVSQLILMSAMKNYFSYKMCLKCNLPKVTLEGTKEDWIKIYQRVDFLRTFKISTELQQWADVLEHVLQHFIDAFDGKIDESGFWNRVANQTGGGSGPTYIEGWILAFYPFDDSGKYCLNSIENICKGKRFGKIDTNDVSTSVVSVPVTIDDNGREYRTKFITGLLSGRTDKEETALRPNIGWALIDVTNV